MTRWYSNYCISSKARSPHSRTPYLPPYLLYSIYVCIWTYIPFYVHSLLYYSDVFHIFNYLTRVHSILNTFILSCLSCLCIDSTSMHSRYSNIQFLCIPYMYSSALRLFISILLLGTPHIQISNSCALHYTYSYICISHSCSPRSCVHFTLVHSVYSYI
jgi:hypothetical protein